MIQSYAVGEVVLTCVSYTGMQVLWRQSSSSTGPG